MAAKTQAAGLTDERYAKRLAKSFDELHAQFSDLLKNDEISSPILKLAIKESDAAASGKGTSLFDEMFRK